MNKTVFKITIFSLAVCFLTGCEDFLNKDVLGYSTDENFYDTQYKLESALNATYDVLQMEVYNQCDWRFGEACGDDVKGTDEDLTTQMGQLVNFRFNTSNEWIQKRYTINYKGIYRANQVIANAHRVRLADEEYSSYRDIRYILGQAKFLRALFYFNLVKTYGGVPIRPEIEMVDNLVVPRSSAEEVYAYIEKDLREAAIMLPAKFIDDDAGRASESAAVALLMKVLMYQATPGIPSGKWEEVVRLGEYFVDGTTMTFGDILHYDASEEDWEELRERLWFKPKALNHSADPYELPETTLPMLKGAYSLEYKDFYGNVLRYYEQFFQSGEFCKGSIFEIVFKESGDGSTGNDDEGDAIYQTLYCNSPLMWATEAILESMFGTDPRRRSMVGQKESAPDLEMLDCGPQQKLTLKWYTPIKERPLYTGDNGKNRRIIRYPEVVLIYAEALNECGEGARALEQLNTNKRQANIIDGNGNLYLAGGYGYMRDQIWSERRKELCFEWDRFFDLVRQKRAAEVIKAFGLANTNKRGVYFRKGVNELFPIPQAEIDLSQGAVMQNPGY